MRRACNTCCGSWVLANRDAIKKALGSGLDVAVMESPAAALRNYLGWYKVIASLKSTDRVNMDTLTAAIKAGKST